MVCAMTMTIGNVPSSGIFAISSRIQYVCSGILFHIKCLIKLNLYANLLLLFEKIVFNCVYMYFHSCDSIYHINATCANNTIWLYYEFQFSVIISILFAANLPIFPYFCHFKLIFACRNYYAESNSCQESCFFLYFAKFQISRIRCRIQNWIDCYDVRIGTQLVTITALYVRKYNIENKMLRRIGRAAEIFKFMVITKNTLKLHLFFFFG